VKKMLAQRGSHFWKPRGARLLHALVCARCAGMTTRVKKMLAQRGSHFWKPRGARLLHALVCARCAGLTTRVKNRSDEPIFHSQGLQSKGLRWKRRKPCKIASEKPLSRISPLGLSAKRFDMEEL